MLSFSVSKTNTTTSSVPRLHKKYSSRKTLVSKQNLGGAIFRRSSALLFYRRYVCRNQQVETYLVSITTC